MVEQAQNQPEKSPAQEITPGSEPRTVLSYLNPFYGTVSLSERLLFTKYFTTLTRAGIPVLRSLGTLARQMQTAPFRKMIWEMRNDVEGGIPLNMAFRKNEDTFGLLYTNLVRVGEESGRLFNVLDRLSTLLDREIKLRRKVLAAMTYPAVITLVATGVVLFLMLAVIPQFAKLFAQFGQELPWLTQQVINVSSFVGNNFLNLIAATVAILLVIYQVNQTTGGRRFFDSVRLKIPVIGNLTQKYAIAMFSRNMATLFQSGVSIITAMKISIETVENIILADALNQVVRDVEGGQPIAKALVKVDIMPELTTQMIEVGEETGNLDDMLEKVAEFYEDEINFMIDQMTALVEPAFILVLGTIVGVIVVAMYLPIFKMAKVVSGGGGGGGGPTMP
ncbi:MAG TPA: type II secretion system F family protein [Candidatus Ozemobacteraceae bacterium]|nr:type II secretion system F family protein [Candidatus Ozemobacteraceae bacterium]HQG29397.1 type II secretion system F family protein [Candidatus Ozemobacteraceae bacterium]